MRCYKSIYCSKMEPRKDMSNQEVPGFNGGKRVVDVPREIPTVEARFLRGSKTGGGASSERNLYARYSKDDYINLVRSECREREAFEDSLRLVEWLKMGINKTDGKEIPLFPQLKTRADLTTTYEKLRKEVEARCGIHAAFRVYDSKRTDLGGLVSSLNGRAVKEGDPNPERKVEYFSLDWLQSLAEAEGNLGKNIGKGISIYVAAGKKDGERYLLELKLKDKKLTPTERASLETQLASVQSYKKLGRLDSTNVFSDALSPAAVGECRKKVSDVVGKDAEELAFRLSYLLGVAGRYGYSQDPGCASRDALSQLFRPNDAWQNKRKFSSLETVPTAVGGVKDDFESQPLRYFSFMVSFSEFAGEVLMADGSVCDLSKALAEGRFADVSWNEVPTSYSGYVDRMVKGYTLNTELLDPGVDEKKAKDDYFVGMKELVEKVLKHQRAVSDPSKKKEIRASNGRVWHKSDPESVSGFGDVYTQRILRALVEKTLRAHHPKINPKNTEQWNSAICLKFLDEAVKKVLEPRVFDSFYNNLRFDVDLQMAIKKASEHVGM